MFSHYVVTDQAGVNSQLRSGDHVILWDFDGCKLLYVIEELKRIQRLYKLPQIHILRSNVNGCFHAYCLARVSWHTAVAIVANTYFVDAAFFRYGVLRGAFTLRVTGKHGIYPQEILTIPSKEPETTTLDELKTFVSYESWED